MKKLSAHTAGLIVGMVILAVGVLLLVPFLGQDKALAGQAVSAPPADYVAKWDFDQADLAPNTATTDTADYAIADETGSFSAQVNVNKYPTSFSTPNVCLSAQPEAEHKTMARFINDTRGTTRSLSEYGLVAWWPYDLLYDHSHQNSYDGTVYSDDYLLDNEGTPPSPLRTDDTSGRFQKALIFDGNWWLSFTDTPTTGELADNLDLSDKYTIELWYKRDTATTGKQRLIGKRDAATNAGFDLWLDNDANKIIFAVKDNDNPECTVSVTAADNEEWNSVVAVLIGSPSGGKPDLRLHYNGKVSGPEAGRAVCSFNFSTSAFANDDPFVIGGGYGSSSSSRTENFLGQIDEVSVWHSTFGSGFVKEPFVSPRTDARKIVASAGKKGSGLILDGFNDGLSVLYTDTSFPLHPPTTISVSAWVKFAETQPGSFSQYIIESSGGLKQEGGYGFSLFSDGLKTYFRIGSGDSASTVKSSALNLNQWYHLTGTYDGTTQRLYVNGLQVDESASTIPIIYGASAFNIGQLGAGCHASNYVSGSLDEVAIYDRALTPDEVQALYREGSGTPCFNQYCPSITEINALKDFTDSASSFAVLKSSLSSTTPSLAISEVTDAATAINLATHQPSFSVGSPLSELTTTSPPTVIGYFRYNNLYTIQLTEYDQYLGTATLKVIRSADNTPVATSIPITLSISEAKPLDMAPITVSLNLDAGLPGGDPEPEVYLHARGFFQKDGKLGIIVIASPFLDLSLLGSGTTILAQPNLQQIKADGSLHKISFANVGGSTLFLVDGKEYSSANWETVGATKKLTHFYDGTHTRGLTFTDGGFADRYWKLTVETFPPDLSQTYKTTFTKDSAAILNGKTFKICTLDSASLFSVNVCDETDNYQSSLKLQADIPYYNQSIDQNLLFLYDDPAAGTAKEVQVFHLFNLSNRTQQNDVTFTNNLVANRPLAFVLKDVEENSNYYLLTHPTTTFTTSYFDPKNLKLLPLGNSILREFSAVATRYEAKFNLPVGKVTQVSSDGRVRQVNIEDLAPAPYFNISGVVNVENRVNLLQDLQTTVSTYGSVILEPGTGLGLVATQEDDRLSDSEEMKIQYAEGIATPTVVTLKKDVPVILEKALVHYTKADQQNGIWTKYANLHHYYDLTASPDNNPLTHPFTDDDFILPLLKGNQLALGVDDSYYLLYYDGTGFDTSTGLLTSLFAINKLKIKRIGGTETLGTPIYDAARRTASFPLSNGRSILLSLGSKGSPGSELPVVNMTSVNAAEARKSAQQKQVTIFDYSRMWEAELPQSSTTDIENVLQVGSAAGSPQYKNCDNQYTREFEQTMLLCSGTTPATVELKLSEVRDTIDNNAIITYRSKVGATKKVTFQKVLGTLAEPDTSLSDKIEWGVLTTNLTQSKHPAIKIGTTYYELDGGQSFSQLKLRNISSGQDSPTIQVYKTAEGGQEGYIVLGTDVISVKQSLQNYKISVAIRWEPFKMVSSTASFMVSLDTSQSFISHAGADGYWLQASASTVGEPIQITLRYDNSGSAGSSFFTTRLPVDVSRRVLLPNADVITITPRIVDNIPIIEVSS